MDNSSNNSANLDLPLEHGLGGVIFFTKDIESKSQFISLIDSIKNKAKLPLFLSIDQEGGRVERTENIHERYLSPKFAFEKGERFLSEQTQIISNELNSYGINMNFAPCIDVNSNPLNPIIGERSFSNNVDDVCKGYDIVANVYKKNNIIPVVKHFPGHGATETDSHISLPIVNKTIEELETSDLIPFTKSIKNTNMIMIGHIALPNITRDNTPSSISKEIITSLLKEKYNYQGLVVTDALNMKALTNNYTYKQIYIMAINAGVDLLLMPNDLQKAIDYIKEAIINKEIDENTINESVYKILKYKNNNIKNNYLDKSYLNKKEYENILRQIKVNE